jgi:hypothetical protein
MPTAVGSDASRNETHILRGFLSRDASRVLVTPVSGATAAGHRDRRRQRWSAMRAAPADRR